MMTSRASALGRNVRKELPVGVEWLPISPVSRRPMSKSKRAQPREVTPLVNWTGVQAHRAEYTPGTIIFGQGDPAPSIMYVEKGAVRLSVLSHSGKEAVVAVFDPGSKRT
jgi:hypothetical protein